MKDFCLSSANKEIYFTYQRGKESSNTYIYALKSSNQFLLSRFPKFTSLPYRYLPPPLSFGFSQNTLSYGHLSQTDCPGNTVTHVTGKLRNYNTLSLNTTTNITTVCPYPFPNYPV